MHIDLGFGHEYRGTPMEILTQMKAVAEGVDELDLGEYIDWIVERAASYEGVVLFVAPGSLHERAESLIREMIAAQCARDLEQDDGDPNDRSTARWVAATEITALQAS